MDKLSAAKAVSKLPQPAGMYHNSWLKMKKVLQALCRYLPDPYPGIRRLSAETKIPARTVADLLTKAEAHGLIARTPRQVPGKHDGYIYRLTCLDSVQVSVQVSDQTCTEEELRSSSLPTVVKKTDCRFASPAARPRKINKYTGRCHVCTEIVWAQEGFLHGPLPVHRECDAVVRRESYGNPDEWGPSNSEDPEAKEPSMSTRPAKPQAYLAKHFETRWNVDALGLHPEWRGIKGLDMGAAIGYIRRTFLDAGYSVEHVEVMIDAFFDDLINPYCLLEIKEGQTAFLLFTGWWGRNPVPDPQLARDRAAKNDQLRAVYHRQRDDARKRESEAWDRITAAQEQGLELDPADLKVVGMPVPRRAPTSG